MVGQTVNDSAPTMTIGTRIRTIAVPAPEP
jgi:hypothetical protein